MEYRIQEMQVELRGFGDKNTRAIFSLRWGLVLVINMGA